MQAATGACQPLFSRTHRRGPVRSSRQQAAQLVIALAAVLVTFSGGNHSQNNLYQVPSALRTTFSYSPQVPPADSQRGPISLLQSESPIYGLTDDYLTSIRDNLGIDSNTGGVSNMPSSLSIESPQDSRPTAGVSIRDIACAPTYSWDCNWALATINCESSGLINNQGSETIKGITYYFNGWWQVEGGSFDPAINTQQAYRKWLAWQRGESSRPWPNCP